MKWNQALLLAMTFGLFFGYSLLPQILSIPLIPIAESNNTQLGVLDAELQHNSYKENFNDYADHFTNTSGWQNVTCGVGDRQGGLQLNYTESIYEKQNLPDDKDNWTEDAAWVGNWFVIPPDVFMGAWLDSNAVVNKFSLAMNYTEICDGLSMHVFVNSTGSWNLTDYDIMDWWYSYAKQFPMCPDMVLLNVSLEDIYGNRTTQVVNQYISPLTWIHFTLNMSNFIADPGFNISAVVIIYWLYTYVPTCEVQIYTVLYDGLHFTDYDTMLHVEDTGVWYSNWINLPGSNMLWSELIIETTHPSNTTIEFSINNITFFPLSTTDPSIAQFLLSSPIIIRITLEKTNNGNSPFVDYLILVGEPILAQLLALFPAIIPQDVNLGWIIATIVSITTASILAIYVIAKKTKAAYIITS